MSKQDSKAVEPVETVESTEPVAAPLISVEQARTGNLGMDVNAFTDAVRTRLDVAESVVRLSVWDAALGFHAIVKVGGSMKQGEYVTAIGKSKQYGTTLARLADAAIRLGVTPGDDVWAYLVQHGNKGPAGEALKVANKRSALKALKGQAAEMREHGKVTRGASVPTGTTPDETPDETPAESTEPTLADVLDTLDRLIKSADRETFASVENRLSAILAREITIRAKVDSDSATA